MSYPTKEVMTFIDATNPYRGELKTMYQSIDKTILNPRSSWDWFEFWGDTLSIFAEKLSEEDV